MHWNLADLFESVVDAVPERPALATYLDDDVRRFTFAELDERATRLAHHLVAAGVRPGDHVGFYLYNGCELLETHYAAWKIRAVPINVNYRYVEAELRYLFDNADLVALVHGREFTPRIAQVTDDCPQLRTFVAVDDPSGADLDAIGAIEYEAALAAASSERDFAARSDDDLYVLYTGGTTGMPKGVMWRQEDFVKSTIAPLITLGGPIPTCPEEFAAMATTEGGKITCFPVAPLMHGAAQWVSLMTNLKGDRLVLSADRHFDPHRVWHIVERERVASVSIVGDAMARPLIEALDEPGSHHDTSSLFAIGSGGAILSSAIKAKIAERLPTVLVIDSLGASETGFQGSASRSDEQGRPQFAMGDHTTVLDEQGRAVEPGSGIVGRLARRGHIPLGYYKDEAKTAATFTSIDGDRWVIPGDMAIVEEDGTITLLGRGSVSINSGGEKVFPEEVESALKAHPDIFDVVVVGVPDDRWGERVTAVVKPREGAQLSVEQLHEFCRGRIASFKAPRDLVIVDELVRSPSGKADYRWARAVATGAAGS